MKKLFAALAGVAATMALSAGSAHALIIDDFTTAQSVSQTGVGSSAGFANGPDILGGERDVRVDVISSQFAGRGASFVAAGGTASGNADSGVAARITLQYDGVDGDATSLGTGLDSVDLLSAGSAFVFSVLANDQAGLSVEIIVKDEAGNTSIFQATTTITVGENPGDVPPPLTVYAPFAAFVGSADFSNVGGIQFALSGARAFDVTIAEIRVPEPATLGLLGTGLLGLGFMARRRRQRA